MERDLTNVVNATVDNVAALVGSFEKGPVEQIVSVTSEKELSQYLVDQVTQTLSIGLVQHNIFFMVAP